MSKRILVVEDQPDNRQIIRDMLAPTDYEITEAENGEEMSQSILKRTRLPAVWQLASRDQEATSPAYSLTFQTSPRSGWRC